MGLCSIARLSPPVARLPNKHVILRCAWVWDRPPPRPSLMPLEEPMCPRENSGAPRDLPDHWDPVNLCVPSSHTRVVRAVKAVKACLWNEATAARNWNEAVARRNLSEAKVNGWNAKLPVRNGSVGLAVVTKTRKPARKCDLRLFHLTSRAKAVPRVTMMATKDVKRDLRRSSLASWKSPVARKSLKNPTARKSSTKTRRRHRVASTLVAS